MTQRLGFWLCLAAAAPALAGDLPRLGLLAEAGFGSGAGVVLRPQVSGASSVRSWSLQLTDWKGREVNRFEGKDAPPQAINWLGAEAKGGLADSGFYKATLSVQTGEGRLQGQPALFSFLRSRELGEIQHVTLFYEDQDRVGVQLPEFVFPAASAQLTPQSRSFLKNVSALLKQRGAAEAVVLAYSDAEGRALSQQRAHAVYAHLIQELGVNPKRLRFRGLAEDLPFADASRTFAKRHTNRVEVWLSKTEEGLEDRRTRPQRRSADITSYISRSPESLPLGGP